ncbi:uncharacterized protein LOC111393118 [Olea europaea var. sylvestris]|uniref:uncharacterized protein LOC111393118 n=1 Tax=Olea europaea var. sylvestris TaxID=158386 RepID=UPI000C1CF529|nr:uncharacterized protein LOC111393118 [Olea europaea var. sylvestris]
MEKDKEQERDKAYGGRKQPPPSNISPMKPVTKEAYGGGMYGEEVGQEKQARKPPASETQSADGPAEATTTQPKHKPPPSTGDRDVDITGQSYIQ